MNASTLALTRTIAIPKSGGDGNRDGTASGRGVANYLTGITIAPDGLSAWVASTKPNTERGLLFGPDLDQDNTVRSDRLADRPHDGEVHARHRHR